MWLQAQLDRFIAGKREIAQRHAALVESDARYGYGKLMVADRTTGAVVRDVTSHIECAVCAQGLWGWSRHRSAKTALMTRFLYCFPLF